MRNRLVVDNADIREYEGKRMNKRQNSYLAVFSLPQFQKNDIRVLIILKFNIKRNVKV